MKPFPKHDSYHVFTLSVWWRLLVAAEPYHFFTCFRQVSVKAKRCFRRCNFVLRLRKQAFLSFPLTWSDEMSTEILSYFSKTDFSHVFTELFRPRRDGNTCEGLTLISLTNWPIDVINSIDKTKLPCYTLPPMRHQSFFRNFTPFNDIKTKWRYNSVNFFTRLNLRI